MAITWSNSTFPSTELDNVAWKAAKVQLGESATFSAIALRAQKIKKAGIALNSHFEKCVNCKYSICCKNGMQLMRTWSDLSSPEER